MGSAGQNGFHDTALAKGPGVVIGRSGASFGQVHYTVSDYWPHNTCLYVTDFHGNHERFAYYFLKNINFAGYNSGSAQPSLNRNFIYPIEITVPTPEEQRAIAHILGTLDDKIEQNRRTNETLEAMARAIFKSWFVDFDPVRAKASGEPPESICRRLGLTPEVLALFPDGFEESELGEIPKGWNIGPLGDVLTFQRGFDLPASERKSGPYPVLAASGPSGTHNECMARGPGVTTGRSGVLGKVFYVHGDYWPLNTSLWVKEFKKAKPAYAFHLLQGIDFSSLNAGSAVPTLNRNHTHTVQVLMPSSEVIERFESMAVMLLATQRELHEQSDTLSILREALLPKLLSGKLQLPAKETIA